MARTPSGPRRQRSYRLSQELRDRIAVTCRKVGGTESEWVERYAEWGQQAVEEADFRVVPLDELKLRVVRSDEGGEPARPGRR